MSQPVSIEQITLGGKTVTLQKASPSEDYQTLQITGLSPTKEETTVIYHLRSNTPKKDLKSLFNGAYDVKSAGTTHKLIVSGDNLEVVYAEPELQK